MFIFWSIVEMESADCGLGIADSEILDMMLTV